MVATRAYVCVLEVGLHFPDSGSLKSKRKELSSIKAQVAGRFGAAVAEVDHQDLWQRATLMVALVGASEPGLERLADRIERHLHNVSPEGLRVERTVRSLADLEP